MSSVEEGRRGRCGLVGGLCDGIPEAGKKRAGAAEAAGLGWTAASGDMGEGDGGGKKRDFWFLGDSDLRSRCIGKRVSVRSIFPPCPRLWCYLVMQGFRGGEGSSRPGQIRSPGCCPLVSNDGGIPSLRARTAGVGRERGWRTGTRGDGAQRRRQKTVEGVPIVECHEEPGDGPVATLLR